MTSAFVLEHLIPDHARCLGYGRVSTERQDGDDKVSLSDQETACKEEAFSRKLKVDAWITDVASGRNINRPGFQAILTFCEDRLGPYASYRSVRSVIRSCTFGSRRCRSLTSPPAGALPSRMRDWRSVVAIFG